MKDIASAMDAARDWMEIIHRSGWAIHSSGYHWEERVVPPLDLPEEVRAELGPSHPLLRSQLRPFLVPNNPEWRWADSHRDQPQSREVAPVLCRAFASLRVDDEDAILAFANRHGMLRYQIDKAASGGEPIDLWNEQINLVWNVLSLLDIAREKSRVRADRIVEWHELVTIVDSTDKATGRGSVVRRWDPAIWSMFGVRAGDSRTVIRITAYHTIDESLRRFGVVSFWADWRRAPSLQVTTESLIGSIWLEVAQLAMGGIVHRQCAGPKCQKYLFVGAAAGGRRASRKVCSERCKKAAQRARSPRSPRRRAANRS